MQWLCDRLGFPMFMVDRSSLGNARLGRFAMSLLPVTYIQFERFLACPTTLGDSSYEEILAANPRATWTRSGNGDWPRFFVTSVLFHEALEYTRWLGDGYDLPTAVEWRAAHRQAERTRLTEGSIAQLFDLPLCAAARSLVTMAIGTVDGRAPSALGDTARLIGLHYDWVMTPQGPRGLGRPPGSVMNPQKEDVSPVRAARVTDFGFRVVLRPEALQHRR